MDLEFSEEGFWLYKKFSWKLGEEKKKVATNISKYSKSDLANSNAYDPTHCVCLTCSFTTEREHGTTFENFNFNAFSTEFTTEISKWISTRNPSRSALYFTCSLHCSRY